MEENIEKRVDLTLFSEKIQELKDQIASVIVGQEQMVDLVLTAILANGHVDRRCAGSGQNTAGPSGCPPD